MSQQKIKKSPPTARKKNPQLLGIQHQPASPARLDSRSEDAKLIHEALGGDQAAFKRLMRKYHDSIYHLIYRIVHNKEQVEDLIQETFVKAFASLKSFNEEYAFSTWLYKIATNSSIDYIRKRKLETFSIDTPFGLGESDYTFELPDSTYSPDREIIRRQRMKLIEEAINKLPEKYKRVILLRHSEERDYADIARILKLPIGTVKAHIFRARELLNKSLRHKIPHY